MAQSLLAHLYTRIKGSQEDVATLSLNYLISQSMVLRKTYTDLMASALHITIEGDLQYSCQSVGENKERPDMVGKDSKNKEVILCEMKFYAGLTPNQPMGYIDRLKKVDGKGLVFVCPKERETSLWAKLVSRCDGREIEHINSRCVSVDGIRMSMLSWGDIINALKEVAPVESASDLQQLEGFCAQMDMEAFIPFSEDDLGAEQARKAQRFYSVIDEVAAQITTELGGKSKAFGNATYYERKVDLLIGEEDYTLSIMYDRELWKSNSSVETPFWFSIYDADWQRGEFFQDRLAGIPAEKKDGSVWQMCYLALMPLTDATFEEVCQDLKEQVLNYLNIFS